MAKRNAENVNQMLLSSQKLKLRFDKRYKVSGYEPVGPRLYNHQTHAILHGLKKPHVGLFLDMGTGKTAIALNIARARYLKGLVKRILIVCPKIAQYSWRKDAKIFAPDMKCHIAEGTVPEKLRQFKAFEEGFFVINFDSFRLMFQKAIDKEPGAAMPIYDMMIVDESHRIKNFKLKKKVSATQYRVANSGACIGYGREVKYRIAMTGTPVSSTLEDLWSQLTFIADGKIVDSNFYKFRHAYCVLGGWQDKQVVGFRNQDDLIARMSEYTMTVSKEECMDLPEKIFHEVLLDMDDTQREIYSVAEAEARLALDYLDGIQDEADEGAGDMTNILTQLLRLRQIASGIVSTGVGKEQEIKCPKLDACEEIVSDALDRGEKIIIFTVFRPSVHFIEAKLKKYNPVLIHGGITDTKRFAAIDEFQGNPDCRVLIAQTDACNESVTLTAANNAIFYSYDFKILTWRQAIDRIHRSGQTKKVNYFTLMSKGTVDEKVYKSLEEKLKFAKGVETHTKIAEMKRT